MANTMLEICMDPRYDEGEKYKQALEDFKQRIGIIGRYLISVPGSSLEFLKPECQGAIDYRLNLAKKKGVKRYVLIDHLTCAAFLDHFGDLSLEEERARHLESLKMAKVFFDKNAPEITFEPYLQDDDDPDKFELITFK